MKDFNLREYLSNNPLLKEDITDSSDQLTPFPDSGNKNIGGEVENEFQNWLDEMSEKFEDEKITLQTVIDYAQSTLQDYGMDDWQPGQPLPENKKSLKEEEDIDYDVIVDELENHIETFKQIAGMGEESRPYFSVTPDEYIEYMDFDDPDRKVVFVVNGEEWEDYKPFTTGAEEIGKIEDIIPGFNIVDLNYVVNPD